MPALLALVSHAARSVVLEPAVRIGDTIQCQNVDEVHVLRISEVGHLGEHAAHVAAMLKRSGWRVTVTDYADLRPRLVLRQRPARTGEEVYAVAHEAGAQLLEDLGHTRPPTPVSLFDPASGKARGGYKTVCLQCGHATQGARHVESHRRNRGHDEFQRVPTAAVPALIAEIRHAQAQASTPEDQEALQEPSKEHVNGITHPTDSAALQALPDVGLP